MNQSVPDLCKFAAEMNPRSSTKESVLRIFTKFMCSLSGTEQLDFRDGHPATLHALFGLLIGDDVMLKMFAALILDLTHKMKKKITKQYQHTTIKQSNNE